MNLGGQSAPGQSARNHVNFEWRGNEECVELIGSFNDWKEPIRMINKNGIHTCTVPVCVDQQQSDAGQCIQIMYLFVIDTVEKLDPAVSIVKCMRNGIAIEASLYLHFQSPAQSQLAVWRLGHRFSAVVGQFVGYYLDKARLKLVQCSRRPVLLNPLFGFVGSDLLKLELERASNKVVFVNDKHSPDTIECFIYQPVGRLVSAIDITSQMTDGCLLVVLMPVNREPLAPDYVASLKAKPSNQVIVVVGNDVTELLKVIVAHPRPSLSAATTSTAVTTKTTTAIADLRKWGMAPGFLARKHWHQ